MTPTLIDLRSDTVTKPSPGMRRAMADAEVGDDVLDGDPTTRRLEERIAELLGTEDALFFPSGTQANQTGIALVTEQGTELLLEANAHLVHSEVAGVAALTGVQIRPITTPDGLLSADLVRGALRAPSPHVPRITALAIENTHSTAGGRVLDAAAVDALVRTARDAGLRVHVDGARLWNAAVAAGVKPARLAQGADTVMVSISKGLGCPVGSCLGFKQEWRARAWEIRKRLGGGMRQSGILAAAGLYALDHNLARIGEDHANAKRFAELLSDSPAAKSFKVRPSDPQTNIVMVDLLRSGDTPESVSPRLAHAGVRLAPWGPRRLRAVTHLDVTRSDVERAARIVVETLR
jgi:threonine aldolase